MYRTKLYFSKVQPTAKVNMSQRQVLLHFDQIHMIGTIFFPKSRLEFEMKVVTVQCPYF